MIKPKAIDHVCLWVRSLAEARVYYERLFGFSCTQREGDDSTLVIESEQIHFFISEGCGESEYLSRQHISFEVESLDNVIASLGEMGICDYQVGVVNFFIHKNYKWCE